ncbi:hypothetical protein PTTG_01218 [Puccinia triticina 1-1 BBBD Race 1]|uniref:Uncharacterized protein n=2 Tax=Puccinia triticina TaxID=208348 RepID=A0A0C4EKE3_PUCT1|nr:uncharacterized protein PtA15_10A439 [Puccinia triticina]OAV98070.1 hypothetical protein PTTG_01218 [Puccinia triticina 1-1 BBBD Race 1]WAQ89016.1 hypothetical protein PtA15_10A439 [Puccinia triticina]WAR59076.1 hypothetical protein PtB15_10B418 [Puccinia triticina]
MSLVCSRQLGPLDLGASHGPSQPDPPPSQTVGSTYTPSGAHAPAAGWRQGVRGWSYARAGRPSADAQGRPHRRAEKEEKDGAREAAVGACVHRVTEAWATRARCLAAGEIGPGNEAVAGVHCPEGLSRSPPLTDGDNNKTALHCAPSSTLYTVLKRWSKKEGQY